MIESANAGTKPLRKRLTRFYESILTPALLTPLATRVLLRNPVVQQAFFQRLINHTRNFASAAWLGRPIWQNILDLWTIQETIFEVKPTLLIETGTYMGGSAFFYASLFDLMGGDRHVVTIDVEQRCDFSHSRITFLIGSSVAPSTLAVVNQLAARTSGPVMVILDSDHSEAHVRSELDLYTPFVTAESYCLVQDGVIDTLRAFAPDRPGPLRAIERFVRTHPNFVVDHDRCNRFLISHHPAGWLRRIA